MSSKFKSNPIEFKAAQAQPAPVSTTGPIAWMRENLFSSIPNIIITAVIAFILLRFIPGIVDWMFISAHWVGTSQDACTGDGACWVFIKVWSKQFFYGSYPSDELWRVNLSLLLLFAVIIMSFTLPNKYRLRVSVPLFLTLPLINMALLDGRLFALEHVSTELWGGFSLNILMAAAAIIIAFPFSFLWALGRRSDMPLARSVSVVFIEFFRGVPVLALFFMGSVMLPLFFSQGTNIDILVRVLIVLIFFMSGYMAEVFRGGFQAVPNGQYEAADSIGLSYWQKTLLIILPQVIKVSMPNILATFVMLFKNTVFLLIIGIPEVLQLVTTALSNSNWLGGHATEGYIFVAIIFWVCCFGMSMLSNRIERQLDTDKRD